MIYRYHSSIINVAKILLTSLIYKLRREVLYISTDTTHVTFVKCTTGNCSCAVDRNHGPYQSYDNGIHVTE